MLQDFSMLTVRKVMNSDREAVFKILKELDLDYPALTLDYFWVAELDKAVVAAARLEEFEKFYFLSALGTAINKQGRGIAAKLLQSLLKKCNKDVYLYTIIPDFFKKFGFGSAPLCSGLPARERFNCEQCYPENCVCMCRKPELAI